MIYLQGILVIPNLRRTCVDIENRKFDDHFIDIKALIQVSQNATSLENLRPNIQGFLILRTQEDLESCLVSQLEVEDIVILNQIVVLLI